MVKIMKILPLGTDWEGAGDNFLLRKEGSFLVLIRDLPIFS